MGISAHLFFRNKKRDLKAANFFPSKKRMHVKKPLKQY
ncbi:type III secretion outer membrane ring component [Simkania negevensis Z]|uniref:Type III secretion outer membrane ring component n=1 Tax=Simkania negevensis (strain ATCC VR-1471 / DSM 27360 / Z) TaxID=331113 RepID=F8L3M8_SIMNZ|nr:type III secretion outer membrane ring component [Simkania negevensis Z]